MGPWRMAEWANYAICAGAGALFLLLVSFFRRP